jgi:hypothetical protein
MPKGQGIRYKLNVKNALTGFIYLCGEAYYYGHYCLNKMRFKKFGYIKLWSDAA